MADQLELFSDAPFDGEILSPDEAANDFHAAGKRLRKTVRDTVDVRLFGVDRHPRLAHRAYCPSERAVHIDPATCAGRDTDFEACVTGIDR